MSGKVQREAGELEQLGRAAMSSKTGRSHLLRHTLPEIDVAEHFGTTDGKEIAKEIARMGQKELQVGHCAVCKLARAEAGSARCLTRDGAI